MTTALKINEETLRILGAKKDNVINALNNMMDYKCRLENGKIIFDEVKQYAFYDLIRIGNISSYSIENINSIFSKLTNFKYKTPVLFTNDQAEQIIDIVKQKGDLKDKLYNYQKLFWAEGGWLQNNFVTLLLPLLQEICPGGELYFISEDELINLKIAAARSLFAINEIPQVFTGNEFIGNQTLQYLEHNTFTRSDMINIYLALFTPYMSGIICDRLGGMFVIFFDKLTAYSAIFPPKISDLLRNDSTYFTERRTSGELYYKDVKWERKELIGLLKDYINGINKLFNYLLDPNNYKGADDWLDSRKWYLSYLTINRITNELLIIETEYLNQYVRKSYFFALIDKLSEMISSNQVNSTEKFKMLLSRGCLKNAAEILSGYANPFGNYFRERLKTVTGKVYESIISNIYIKTVINDQEVKINERNVMTIDEYVPAFLREIRNTHHGYNIKNLDVVKIHNGNIPDTISDIGIYLWLTMLMKPKEVMEGELFKH